MEIARPFIRLPYQYDGARLAEEISALPDSAWMAHPQRMNGNTAAALISRGGGDNDDFDGHMQETSHLSACPYLRQVLASFGEVLGRSRLMKLAAGAEVATHVDFNYHWYSRVRIHIPIVTNPRVTFFCADRQVHMAAGESWLFNSWRRHRVSNEGDADRVHLVIDTAGSSRFWAVVRSMQQYDHDQDREKIAALVRAVPYDPDSEPGIRTERYNASPVMAPGEVAALVESVIDEFEKNPDNDAQLVIRYKTLLQDFASDWREIWHLHGYQPHGWPLYRRAIDGVFRELHPDPKALLTSSNKIRVNPIIVHRILSAALSVDQMDQFVGSLGKKS